MGNVLRRCRRRCIRRARKRATPEQALLQGVIYGAIEYGTEKLPMDKLFELTEGNTKLVSREGVKAILTQAGLEGNEELISSYADSLTDIAINGNSSQYEQTVRSYRDQGLSRKDAEGQAIVDIFIVQPIQDAAGGALSGGLMSTGGMAYGNVMTSAYGSSIDPASAAAYANATGDASIAQQAQQMNPRSAYDRGAVVAAAQEAVSKLTPEQHNGVQLRYRQNIGDVLSPVEQDALTVLSGQKLEQGEIARVRDSVRESQAFKQLTGIDLNGDISTITAAVTTEAKRNAQTAAGIEAGAQMLADANVQQAAQSAPPAVQNTVQNAVQQIGQSRAQRAISAAQTAFSRAGIRGNITETNSRRIYTQAAQQLATHVENSSGYTAIKKYARANGVSVQSLIHKSLSDGFVSIGSAQGAVSNRAAANELAGLLGVDTRRQAAPTRAQQEAREAQRQTEQQNRARNEAAKRESKKGAGR